jgi:starch-binding outer membrane protein, SusD/RagB family
MNYFRNIVLLTCTVVGIACSKNQNLEDDPNSSGIKTLADCQSLLNNRAVFNETPVLGEISSDNYFIDADFWQDLSKADRNAYTWQVDVFEGQKSVADYSIPYAQVHIANQVLAALSRIRISVGELGEKNNIEGTAYFFRAYAFYNLLQLFAMPYESATALDDFGIALPLTPDINTIYKRASMKDSYGQVITDLQQARKLLIANVYHNQPSKPAADALLARVFLSMRDYVNAANYADSCLQQYNTLMNYNTLDPSAKYPIPYLNDEILYYSNLLSSNGIILARVGSHSIVDTTLYASYAVNDLRKEIFFLLDKKLPVYSASYTGNTLAFSGLATDEIFLIRAECRARAGDVERALEDVNTLLRNRYKEGSFQPYYTTSFQDALQLILEERNKELVFRGLRWTDLRRLNKDGAGIVLRRKINGNLYQLPPNDLRYIMPIPADAITNSKIVQNPRE